MRLLGLVFAVLLKSCLESCIEAQRSDGSGATPRPCFDAGYKSCCPGRNDSCLGSTGVCYCDEYCYRSNTEDCCDDLALGMLPCDLSGPDCARTLEAKVRGLAEIQTLIGETYVGLPDHFGTPALYLQNLARQVRSNLYTPFDADSNDVLDIDEFHLLYQGIISDTNAKMPICKTDLHKFCDDNEDNNITAGELELCTGVVPYCDTPNDTALMLSSELLVSQLQPVLSDAIGKTRFESSDFRFADRNTPRNLLDMNEFRILYGRIISLYNVLPSVCPESVFELCNTNSDQFISLEEFIKCATKT